MNETNRIELANKIAAHFNANGNIPQKDFNPDYRAKVWIKGEIVRIYITNGGKQLGMLVIEESGKVSDRNIKLGGYGYDLLRAVYSEI